MVGDHARCSHVPWRTDATQSRPYLMQVVAVGGRVYRGKTQRETGDRIIGGGSHFQVSVVGNRVRVSGFGARDLYLYLKT